MVEPLTILLVAALAATDAPWSVVADDEGVRVESATGDGSGGLAFRAEGIVEASPVACFAAVRADDFFLRTAPHVTDARVVASDGARVRWFYARLDPPFIAARDYTLRIEEEEDPSPGGAVLRLIWRTDNARGPAPRPGTVRVERSEGSWTFRPMEGGKRTLALYELQADPGGSIPGWIAAKAQVAGIFAAFEELRRASTRSSP